MRTIDDIRNEWVDAVGQEAERFGFPRIAAELKTLLLLTPGPMSLTEMAERLEVSKASVSTNIRILERWKLVRRVYHRGERRNFYETKGNMWEIETEIASTILKDELTECRTLVSRSLEDLGSVEVETPEDEKEVRLLKDTFSEALEYIDAWEHILNLFLERGEITPAVLKKVKIT
jgi:DNA-binding transcriptional regulator GbsR (MarR family)